MWYVSCMHFLCEIVCSHGNETLKLQNGTRVMNDLKDCSSQ